MPTVLDMTVDGHHLEGVIGNAHLGRNSVRIRLSEGSNLNIATSQHYVTFTVPQEMLRVLQPRIQLQSTVTFSAKYSTGEKISNAPVLVKNVDYLDRGDIAYTLSVAPNEAVIDIPNPG